MTKVEISGNPLNLALQRQMEESVIGIAISEQSDEVSTVIDALEPKHFYTGKNKKIWKLIKQVHREHGNVDLLILVAEANRNSDYNAKDYTFYLTTLNGRYTSGVNLQYHASYLIEAYMRFHMHQICAKNLEKCENFSYDVLTLHDGIRKQISDLYEECFSIMKRINGGYASSVIEVIERELQQVEKDISTGTVSGLYYGIPGVDEKTDLMMPGDLIIVAARPSMGKSLFALQCALYNAVTRNLKVNFYSMEMTQAKLAHRMISMYTDITSQMVLYRNVSKENLFEIRRIVKQKLNNNLIIYDDPDLSVADVETTAEKDQANMLILDYLQLMRPEEKSGSRENDVSSMSRGLKRIAMKQKIPVMALSQLSRKVEERSTTQFRPQLSDLRESGAIEQDADTVMFLYRPSQYKLKNQKYPDNITEFIFAKQRNGKLVTVPGLFDSKTNQFTKYENNDSNESESYQNADDGPGF